MQAICLFFSFRCALIRNFLQSATIKCCNFSRDEMRYEPLSLDVATSQFEISDIPKNHTLDFSLVVCCEPLNVFNCMVFERFASRKHEMAE